MLESKLHTELPNVKRPHSTGERLLLLLLLVQLKQSLVNHMPKNSGKFHLKITLWEEE